MDIDAKCNTMSLGLTDACKTSLGVQPREDKKWISNATIDLINLRRKNPSDRSLYNAVRRSLRKDNEGKWSRFTGEVEHARNVGDARKLFQLVKSLQRKPFKTTVVRDKSGSVVEGKENKLLRWKEHFEELLNRPPPEVQNGIGNAGIRKHNRRICPVFLRGFELRFLIVRSDGAGRRKKHQPDQSEPYVTSRIHCFLLPGRAAALRASS